MQAASTFALAAGMAFVPVLAPAATAPGVWQLHEEGILGAPANFVVTAHNGEHVLTAVAAAHAEIDRLDAIFNSRRTESELSRLNGASDMVVSPELFEVLTLAEQMRQASCGAFNGGLGDVLAMWRSADATPPDEALAKAAALAAQAPVGLDAATRRVVRPEGVRFALDSVAKGYIVDRALEAGMAAAPVAGMAVDIGGDIRCKGHAPTGLTWDIDIPDPAQPLAAAPIVAAVHLKDGAVATSGKGPRDFSIGGRAFSATLSPDGQAAHRNIAATVTAPTAAQADALATALLVMHPSDGLKLAAGWPGAEARITSADGAVCATEGWSSLASEPPARLIRVADTATSTSWLGGYALNLGYRAAPGANRRFVAIWLSDANNQPIRTLLLVGTRFDWQKDNYVWASMYKDRAPRMIQLYSVSTQTSGAYSSDWLGYDDAYKFTPLGQYTLNIETSLERGGHSYRSYPITFGRDGFSTTFPVAPEGGTVQITYGKKG